MGNETTRKSCLAVVGSLTQAMQAQRVLTAAAVLCHVEKADSAVTRRGCAYGVSFPCAQEAAVRRILREAGIRVRGGTGGG